MKQLECNPTLGIILIMMLTAGYTMSYDEQLYSRQVLVYGQSAQQRLSLSHVLIIGEGALAAEVLKNLVLAGVGEITILDPKKSQSIPLLGDSRTISEFVHGLNSYVKISTIFEVPSAFKNYSVVLVTGKSFKDLNLINNRARNACIPLVCSDVRGVSAYIFNDLINFTVLDADGEDYPEIPLAKLQSIPLLEPGELDGDSRLLSIQSIPEERLSFGLNDTVLLTITDINTDKPVLLQGVVQEVRGLRDVIIRISAATNFESSIDALLLANSRGLITCKKVKIPINFTHESLEQQLSHPTCIASNECVNEARDRALRLTLLAAFSAYYDDPRSSLRSFAEAVEVRLRAMSISEPRAGFKAGGVEPYLSSTLNRFWSSARGICPATVSVIGALAAQEVVKVCTQVFKPLSQWLLFESLDSLYVPNEGLGEGMVVEAGKEPLDFRDDLIDSVYGAELMSELQALKLLVVGAGAIGCELMKTMALMGVGSGADAPAASDNACPGIWSGLESGGVIITDMDHIEKSNLNRQLLFRPQHIGMPKAVVAADRVRSLHPANVLNMEAEANQCGEPARERRGMRVKPLTARMDGSSTSRSIFDGSFWAHTDVVLTALDNIDARMYVDSCCVRHKRWLLDSGTLGAKGNIQVVIPYVTESYSSSADPPEEAVPLCTLKSFPYLPEHCVAWAKSIFEDLFSSSPRNMGEILRERLTKESNKADISALLANFSPDEQLNLMEDLRLLAADNEPTPIIGLMWAMRMFQKTFEEAVNKLLHEHPADSLDEDEQGSPRPFWSGGRRLPKVVQFDAESTIHKDFVVYGAMLWGRSHGFSGQLWERDSLTRLFDEVSKRSSVELDSELLDKPPDSLIIKLLPEISSKKAKICLENLCPQEFEKDAAELGHVDFVAAAANVRCEVYGIRSVTRVEAQKVAGRIVPAIATTTALVSGLVCLELLKLAGERIRARRVSGHAADVSCALRDATAQEKCRITERFRNAFVNIARPMLAFAQPVSAEAYSVRAADAEGGAGLEPPDSFRYTIWDVIEVPLTSSECTVRDIEELLMDKYSASLQSVSCRDVSTGVASDQDSSSDILVYADFLSDADERRDYTVDKLLASPISDDSFGALDLSGDRESNSEPHRSDKNVEERSAGPKIDTFVDLLVSCVDATGDDLRLPPIRVYDASSIPDAIRKTARSRKAKHGSTWSVKRLRGIFSKGK